MKEQDLSATSRSFYLKAKHAMEIKNYGYVHQLMAPVLKESPGFLDGRKLVRAAAISQHQGKKGGGSIIGGTSMLFGSKKDPLASIELAEKTLAADPYSSQANQLLFESANRAKLPEVAAFALEILVGNNPKDTKLLHQLARHYETMGQNDKAVTLYNRIAQINPADLDAMKRGKDAAASATMKTGGWQEVADSKGSKDYRDLIKNKEQTQLDENRGKVVRTADQIGQQVGELYGQWESQQSNVDLSRRLAALYEQWFEVAAGAGQQEDAETYLNNAIWYFAHTATLVSGGDANITRKKTDLEMKRTSRRIKALEDYLTQVDPESPDAKPYADELESLREQRDSTVIDTAKKRVADNPTDLQLRYELGEVLKNAGKFTEAVPELQRAKQNPNVRLKAMNLLGQCFVAKSMFDLAVTQFKTAVSEITGMDVLKKELLYQLGTVYDKMGKKEESIACMKEIYEVDYNYLDVAERVEGSYVS